MKRLLTQFFVVFLILQFSIALGTSLANAEESLDRQIENKQAEIDGMKRKIDEYQKKIKSIQSTAKSLSNELLIIDNKIKKTEFDIREAELEISKNELEKQRVQMRISDINKDIAKQKEYIGIVLQKLHASEETDPMYLIFGKQTFSEFFEQWQYLRTLQDSLSDSVTNLRGLQTSLESEKQRLNERQAKQMEIRMSLEKAKLNLSSTEHAKVSLLSSTKKSESEYAELVRELKEEQQYTTSELFRLQNKMQDRLKESDSLLTGPIIMSWPVSSPVITATFHDPDYPFRNLFEHSGVDMAVPSGTQVRSVAPGYVAFARTGRSYGNYIMIIHTSGVATLYAHLSKMNVAADQFVERGQVIGKSGGVPGTQGAGLSTGAHLHFEARENGIPVNPYKYLVSQ